MAASAWLRAEWAHPGFVGDFLPAERASGSDGFTATWRISSFATEINSLLQQANAGHPVNFNSQQFGVSFVAPVDVYLQSERSVKYGLLFIGLTFVAFLLFEILKKLPVHPIQNVLVGLSLSFFYLLLIAFSEPVGFGLAYLIGSLACSGLLAVYTGSVLRNRGLGYVLGLTILLLYGASYVIIRSEDHALLMGSLLLFGMLALVMLSTRRLDWYELADSMGGFRKAAR